MAAPRRSARSKPRSAHPPLPPDFYVRTPIRLARALLGCLLVRERPDGSRQVGRIVETEAYLGVHDLAAHSAKGRTPRTRTMFGPGGHAYVYLVYGLHHCFNVVVGRGAAVLVRALEPVEGISQRTDGPGRLAAALGIDRTMDATRLDAPPLWIAPGERVRPGSIERSPRIGVDYAGAWAEKPYRFHVRGNRFVSRARRRSTA